MRKKKGGRIMLDAFVVLDQRILAELKNDLEEEFSAIVDISLQAMSERAHLIQGAISRQELTLVRSAAHQIKSNSRQLGALRVGKIAEQVEKLSASGSVSDLSTWGDALVMEVGSAKKAILEYTAIPPADHALPVGS
ncbi:MAG: Hpt domain-containing protein [Magnetococcales bacterium]|nr:Hpt domain-containing protein [Magnetococcales bacterium]